MCVVGKIRGSSEKCIAKVLSRLSEQRVVLTAFFILKCGSELDWKFMYPMCIVYFIL